LFRNTPQGGGFAHELLNVIFHIFDIPPILVCSRPLPYVPPEYMHLTPPPPLPRLEGREITFKERVLQSHDFSVPVLLLLPQLSFSWWSFVVLWRKESLLIVFVLPLFWYMGEDVHLCLFSWLDLLGTPGARILFYFLSEHGNVLFPPFISLIRVWTKE